MLSINDVRELIYNERKYLRSLLNTSSREQERIYTSSLDSLSITRECLEGPGLNGNFSGEMYFLTIKYKGNIVMSMCCFPNNEYKFQFNMLITKYWSKECPPNISILMHSFAASLFNNDYILTRPLRKMGEILIKEFPNLWIVERFGDLMGCSDEIINSTVSIAGGEPTYCIRITDEFRKKYLEKSDLEFNVSRLF